MSWSAFAKSLLSASNIEIFPQNTCVYFVMLTQSMPKGQNTAIKPLAHSLNKFSLTHHKIFVIHIKAQLANNLCIQAC